MRNGDYVRSKYGDLFIQDDIVDNEVIPRYIQLPYAVWQDEIIKHSPNIIDLIEVGDYVDRLRVVDKEENYIVVETFDERIVITKEDTINSVVTKECFESMEYKVKE